MHLIWKKMVVLVALSAAIQVLAQDHRHDDSGHDLWPSSLETITISGSVLIDTSFFSITYTIWIRMAMKMQISNGPQKLGSVLGGIFCG
jgi:hypothetical protein